MTRPHGFTLIELMVTIAVFAILASIAVPSFRFIIENNRVTTASNELTTAFNYARSEAVRRGLPVSVCPIGSDWDDGWQVVRSEGCGGDLLRQWSELPIRVTIGPSGEDDDFIAFDALGGRMDTAAGDAEFTFLIQPEDCAGGDRAREIYIAAGGRSSVQRVACQGG
ncbi:GspH/FimT family pseudopilin [Thioalkalivibrio sp. ALMg13-2]|uniref:GspH/FimT family pseudopilin n=1 Tax=Thioalkalivibrio sp. ALMg13-2 TaxID=1158167 RepID=UPI0003719AF2|nr:GspH/FimT family pseudopilin [Thioalkalivibrio sp. ALMg13-2]